MVFFCWRFDWVFKIWIINIVVMLWVVVGVEIDYVVCYGRVFGL